MTKSNWVGFVCVAGLSTGVVAQGVGCSSSSGAGATQQNDAATEASTPMGDAASSNISLTWGTQLYTNYLVPKADGGAEAGAVEEAGTPEAGAADDAGGDDASADASTGDSGSTVVADSGTSATVRDAGDGGIPGIPGVQACAFLATALPSGTIPDPSKALDCVTTADDGTFSFPNVPVRTNLVLTLNKTGYTPVALSIQTASSPMDERSNPITLYPSDANPNPIPGLTVDWQNKGQIFFFAIGDVPDAGNGFGGVPGATVTLSPMSGVGPYYQNLMGDFVPTATSFIRNLGGYFNLDPGTYTMTYADPNMINCQPLLIPAALWGFPLTMPAHSLQVLVIPGYISGLVGELCTPIPPIVKVDGG